MFSKFFGKKEDKAEVEIKVKEPINLDIENMSYDQQITWLAENKWCVDYKKDRKNILIMDDRDEIISSVIDDLVSLDETDEFYLDDFNIITVSTKMAGFLVLDILEKAPDVEINFALLDIILGGKKSINGKRKMIDGVDVAIQIWEHWTSADILFFSGCIIENTDDPTSFKNRFDTYTGDDMNNYIMPKDTSFDQELVKLTNFFNGFAV